MCGGRSGDTEQIEYYVTLALTICQRVEASNSDVFTRCMFDLYFMPKTTPAEKRRILRTYHTSLKTSSYYDTQEIYSITRRVDGCAQDHNTSCTPFCCDAMCPCNLQNQCLIRKTSYNHYQQIMTIARRFVQFLVYINLLEEAGILNGILHHRGSSITSNKHVVVLFDKFGELERDLITTGDSSPLFVLFGRNSALTGDNPPFA